jgi:hypothetical protein
MTGRTSEGRIETVRIVPDGSPVANYAFDVTPARLVTGSITERGVLKADREALARAFPERAGSTRQQILRINATACIQFLIEICCGPSKAAVCRNYL